MAIAPEEKQGMIDKIMELFQSNEASIEYGNDPNAWVEENLPEDAEPGDVASCMPDVSEGMGGAYQANAARYNASHGAQAQAATSTVVNEISYTYNTIYQQNAFIYAEEGAQVVNIQGNGNHVTQTQIDNDYNAEHPKEYDDYENGEEEYEDGNDVEDNGDDVEDNGDDMEDPVNGDADGDDGSGHWYEGKELTEDELDGIKAKYPDNWEDQVDPPPPGGGMEEENNGGNGSMDPVEEPEEPQTWDTEDTGKGMEDPGDDGTDGAPEPDPMDGME